MPTDAEMLAWLIKTAPLELLAIAWRVPVAREHEDPRAAIAAAMLADEGA